MFAVLSLYSVQIILNTVSFLHIQARIPWGGWLAEPPQLFKIFRRLSTVKLEELALATPGFSCTYLTETTYLHAWFN